MEFGECIWYLKPKSRGKMKAENKWRGGVWLGIREESGEYIIGTEKGTIKVRTVRRKGSEEDRWNWDEFTKIQGTPWEPIPGRPGIELTANIGAEKGPREIIPKDDAVEQDTVMRRFRITKEEVRAHGITPGCKGCARALGTGTSVNHSDRCRK